MESRAEPLLVRQHERINCHLRAQVTPIACARSRSAGEASGAPAMVRLARTMIPGGDGSGVVSASVTDCSPGGMGIQCPVFFPRSSTLNVRVTRADGSIVFDGDVRVQRVVMIGREPTYYLGAAFTDRPGDDRGGSLMEEARRSLPGVGAGGRGAGDA